MASLSCHSKGWKVRFRIYYPTGEHRVAAAYRTHKRDAEQIFGLAHQLEAVTHQNALTRQSAIPFVHWNLLRDQDLEKWFPGRQGLSFDAGRLLDAYERFCNSHLTSASAIRTNLHRARHLIARLGDLSATALTDVRHWQQSRTTERARKTVNLETDVLCQLFDLGSIRRILHPRGRNPIIQAKSNRNLYFRGPPHGTS